MSQKSMIIYFRIEIKLYKPTKKKKVDLQPSAPPDYGF